jgi:hypothetical protein
MSTYRTLGQVQDIRERLVERRQRQRRQADQELALTGQAIGFWYGLAAGVLSGSCTTLVFVGLYKLLTH